MIHPHASASVAMEPGLGGQEKAIAAETAEIKPSGSQWSLALAARKRSLEVSLKLLSYIVAMEPGLGGQEKGLPHGHLQGLPPVAMEPGLGGQEKDAPLRLSKQAIPVAMEPGLGGQEKVGGQTSIQLNRLLSQWSLALAARKRHHQAPTTTHTRPRRNGAWPWRPGKGAVCEIIKAAWDAGRNGAWPWRPGKGSNRPPENHRRPPGRNGAWPWRPGKGARDFLLV